jgi:hypothetical protein
LGLKPESGRADSVNVAPQEYFVYVIELDDRAGPRRRSDHPNIYVGQSVHPPRVRFQQHLDGYKASRVVRRFGLHLRPGLYHSHNPLPSRQAALSMEKELTRRLKNRGYTVFGGH